MITIKLVNEKSNYIKTIYSVLCPEVGELLYFNSGNNHYEVTGKVVDIVGDSFIVTLIVKTV